MPAKKKKATPPNRSTPKRGAAQKGRKRKQETESEEEVSEEEDDLESDDSEVGWHFILAWWEVEMKLDNKKIFLSIVECKEACPKTRNS